MNAVSAGRAEVPTRAAALWREASYIFIVGVVAAWSVAHGLRKGSRSFFIWPDAREQTYAWFQKLARCWHAGYLPLWDANTFAGHSFAGEFQAGVFYPLNWLWLSLFADADGISRRALEGLVVLHFSIAAMGTAVLLRHWRLGRTASAAGAIVFALLGPVALRSAAQPNIFFGLCLLPWALYLASRHLRSGSIGAAAGAGAGAIVALQILAGHVQPAFHTALAIAAMLFARHWRTHVSAGGACVATLRSGAIMAIALLLVSAPQWILSMQYLRDAYRWVGGDTPIAPDHHIPYKIFAFKFILDRDDLFSLIDPWRFQVSDANTLFVGSVTLWLITWFVIEQRRRNAVPAWREHGGWLAALAGFGFVVMLGHATFLPVLLRRLPLAGDVRELGRYAILLQLGAAVLAACAIEALWLAKNRSRWRAPSAWLALTTVLLLLIYWYFDKSVLSPAALGALACALLAAFAWHLFGSGKIAVTVSLLALLITARLFQPLHAPNARHVQDVAEAFGDHPLLARVEAEWGRERVLIDDSAGLPQNYADAHRLQSIGGHGATMYRPYFDFLNRDWSIDSEADDLLNARYVITRSKLGLPLLGEEQSGLRLYERPSAYPRVFLASQYGAPAEQRRADFDLLQYDDHMQRFRITAQHAESAVVSEIAYPGWCATVNGKPVTIERAILGGVLTPLRQIPLEQGINDIEFRYRPYYALLFGCA